MVIPEFTFARTPAVRFGPGSLEHMERLIPALGRRALVVFDTRFARASDRVDRLLSALERERIKTSSTGLEGEPSPDWVDQTVSSFHKEGIDVVLAVGGGSAIDAGKAVSAMLLQEGSVVDYLEGVGTGAVHDGSKVPFVAVPTTAGTGSEATKNAVLSRVGPGGFKKSLRHDRLVPDLAILDPGLLVTCPPHVTAACGMDALTQLLESYVSQGASPLTDALALSGLSHMATSLIPACKEGGGDVEVRGRTAYAALLSGITLANAGLGVVHGLASAFGGAFPIPHGVVCGTLVGALTKATINKLLTLHGTEHPAQEKYARAGTVLGGGKSSDKEAGCRRLVETLESWIDELEIPRLGTYGIAAKDLDMIIQAGGNKKNPVPLDPGEIRTALLERL
ncbi:MAG: iron-containing alcohol dehydrogenase [Planctomycetota bacterium]|jgi:alcohol dehydrogenase class IV